MMLTRLLVYTGYRASGVRTLKWKDYRGGHWHLTDSKTGAKTVYLCSAAIDFLKAWSSDSEYLFHSTEPSKPMLSCTLWHAWQQIR
ncbi:tyrosine-type recombinase/integrase [Vibrio brasiliensis]|uniref:tyrosine-type recombinase/integrase n=1 Tax=Vibrio brasiliensis TaxID=170652 RepID=UPI003CE4BAB2